MNVLDATRKWLRDECPLIDRGNRFNANYLGTAAGMSFFMMVVCISPKQYESREEFHKTLLEKLKESGVELIVLAGFLVAIPPMIVEAYPNKIINIHPSLIPSFCGVGYYGLHVHEKALSMLLVPGQEKS